ncbi:PREDICTED: galactosylgalactosylxylosylprotein 3-beta-glucuronosyltransferase 3-like [Branchiostoma belcheri]|uniref:Galactosylgalactosylxylosylprotein 3-beta-glucuronosyltransferase n=1 Tax=Branchiostoma belcheri TaxID=7741 RepID=A0A6P4Z0W3_BRABE|nr:PREDICTED: galactosylgalactosylxylosylprotein 3-beta-glucuronosyltransferase 3-like [Branchiostoma belcheri]XP_019624693.1 PREDICTED: galactosylgalactosylxylosylprotein 3-beta-glucuronosyltransferase 3-like [Branchiostoma belcheri]
MARLLSLKKLLLVYFVMSTGALLWLILNFGLFCHTSSKEEETLLTKTRELRHWEERLRRRERDLQKKPQQDASLPTIYAIMPTHTRHVQKAELTRLAQTFLHVKNFHWILVEDSHSRTDLVTSFLASCGIKYTHLNIKTPEDYQLKETDPNWLKPRGVEQRNVGLQWLREHLDEDSDKGVVYFADDDNTYSLQLFDEMRQTRGVSVWPVGLVGGMRFERPVVEHGRVVRWYTYWRPERPFAIDMAGFAVNLQLILENPQAKFELRVRRGYLESSLLEHLITMDELEPLADNCTKVLVWHTRTEKPKMKQENQLIQLGRPSDPRIEV